MIIVSVIDYYNTEYKQYNKIITLNKLPIGPLKNYIIIKPFNQLSSFKQHSQNCIIGIKNPSNTTELLTVDDISYFLILLSKFNYTINYNLAKLLKKNNNFNTLDDILFVIDII